MTRTELEKLTKTELAQMCKERNVKRYNGKSLLTKEQLIDNLIDYQILMDDVQKKIDEAGEPVKQNVSEEQKELKKAEYVDGAQVGMLVAFNDPDKNGRLNTAMIKNKSTKRKMFRVETSYGAVYDVPYSDIAWVKTGSRWPRGIYNALKGINV